MKDLSIAKLALYFLLVIVGLALVLWALRLLQAHAEWRAALNDLVQMGSAIGTLGAVVFAVFLTRLERYEAKQQARDASVLRAAGLAPPLKDAVHALGIAVARYQNDPGKLIPGMYAPQVAHQKQVELTLDLICACKAEVFFQSPETLASFVELSNHCAYRFYSAGTNLRQVLSEYEAVKANLPSMLISEISERADRWASIAEKASAELWIAQVILENLAKQVAPTPVRLTLTP